jgi:hypothetical protein
MAATIPRTRDLTARIGTISLPSREVLVHRVALPLLIMALGWSSLSLQPGSGLDESWVASLYMAIHNGLSFGRDVVFTFGPLGFLNQPQAWYVPLAQVAVAYTLVLRFAVAYAVYASLRKTFGSVGAFAIAVVIVSLGVGTQFGELVVFLAAAVWALYAAPGDRRVLAVVVGGGAFAALQLLVKVSIGGSLAVMLLVLVLTLPASRRLYGAYTLGTFIVSLLTFWLIAGQPVDVLPHYLWYSATITAGYTPAMGVEATGLGWQYTAAFVGLGLGLWAAWRAAELRSSRQRWGLAILWLSFWFATFKEGFVRHDLPHAAWFFVGLLGGLAVLRWPRTERVVAAVGVASLAAFTLASQGASLDLRLGHDVRSLVSDVSDTVSASKLSSLQRSARAYIQESEPPINGTTMRLIAGHTVAIYPTEQDIAWAYGLTWDPIPVLQSYAAYTSSLDALDAGFLASERAPTRVLFQGTTSIDYRLGAFDESATLRTMLCRYRPLYANRGTLVLSLVANRCTSPPTRLRVVHAGWGQVVTVPAPPTSRSLVYVDIDGAGAAGFEQLESLFSKPSDRNVSINGGVPFRFIPGTATDGLPLRLSPTADWPRPYNVAVGANTISIAKSNGQGGGKPLTYTFYAETIAPYRR